jgi:hypothetical protein
MCEPFITRQISIRESNTLTVLITLKFIVSVVNCRIDICRVTKGSHILAKSLIISFQYNIESVYFFDSNRVYSNDYIVSKDPNFEG